jgi:hypothetical protein
MKRMGPKVQGVIDSLAVVVFVIAIGGILATFLGGCAGWDKKSCAAIDLAHQACAVVTFIDADGNKQTMKLSQEDARELGKVRAASRDAGADSGK